MTRVKKPRGCGRREYSAVMTAGPRAKQQLLPESFHEVELESWADDKKPAPPRCLHAVLTKDLEEELCRNSPRVVLATLASEDNSLRREISPASCKCALVSYRQERDELGVKRCCSTQSSDALQEEFSDHTLDGEALRGVLDACHALGVDALWLDAWCYRYEGKYDHAAFCQTLHEVVSNVVGVVWLPRSKRSSLGHYPYRLWCTFEAACVELRSLPVQVAGTGLSSFQWRVRLLGSFTPALTADGILDDLCRLNLIYYTAQIVMLCSWIDDIIVRQEYVVNLILAVVLVPMWLALRATVGQQVRLAGNARRVLRAMSNISSDNASCMVRFWRRLRQGKAASDEGGASRHIRWLLRDLPWLPAFDKRDGLIVQELLGRIRPDMKMEHTQICALAYSAYAAARQSSGAESEVWQLSLAQWLAAKDIHLDAPSLPTLSIRASAQAGGAETERVSTWLHDVAAANARMVDCLPWHALQHHGWVLAPGLSCAFINPLGMLAVFPPMGARWLVNSASVKHLRRGRVIVAGTWWLALVSLIRPPCMIIWHVYGFHSVPGRWAHTVLWMMMFAVCAGSFLIALLREDILWAACHNRVCPFPQIIFHRMLPNVLLTIMYAAFGLFWLHWAYRTRARSPDLGEWQPEMLFISSLVFCGLLLYLALINGVFVLAACSRYRAIANQGVQTVLG
jgi:hypothetical protein